MNFDAEEFYSILATDQVAFTEQCFATVSPADAYKDNWHIHCIIEHLQAVERGEIRRLIINMPPRCLKSICVSIAWPAWLLGKNPSAQIMVASYVQELAKAHSVDTRLILESEWYNKVFPFTKIATDQNEKTKFKTTKQGHRMAYSVGASRIGQGGDYLILDDPVNPEDALSDTVRGSTNRWIGQSFLTRENDPTTAKAVLVMQRLHEEDPTGYLLDRGWEQLVLPAYFEEKTIIEVNNKKWICEEGDYLQPDRLGEDQLDTKLRELGMYGFVGQYQQKPSPEGGGEFKTEDLQYYDNYNKKFSAAGMNVYILYDPANVKKTRDNKDPDYTAMVVVGLANDNNYYILDLVRDRLNPSERIDKLIDLHMKWNKKSGKPPKVVAEQYGMMTDNFYLKERQDEYNYRFQVIEVGGQIKKEDRIRKLIPLFESKRVFLPRKILYDSVDGNTYELGQVFVKEELSVFPVGRHDDMIDALARITDEKVNATFPKINIVYLEGGQSHKDLIQGDYDGDDFMTW